MKEVQARRIVQIETDWEELDLIFCALSYAPSSQAHEWGHSPEKVEDLRADIGRILKM